MPDTVASFEAPATARPADRELFAAPHKKIVLLGLALILGVVMLYQPLQSCGFVNYDDSTYVQANIQVRNGLTWKNVGWAFTTTTADNWHPLTWLSHMLDVTLFRLNPAGHHLSSVFFHATNSFLLFFVLW